MTALCPSGYTLDSGYCYSLCPSGTETIAGYPEYCVSTVQCQLGTVVDTTGLACTKTEPVGIVTKTTTCPSGFFEWTSGLCYINCNSYFLENATDCRKRLYQRRSTEPYCNNFFHYLVGNRCAFDYSRFLLTFLIIIILSILIYRTLLSNPMMIINNKH